MIERKAALLESWASNGVPCKAGTDEPEWCPTSLRDVAKWKSGDLSPERASEVGKLVGTSRETIAKYPHLRAQIESALKRLKNRAKARGAGSIDQRLAEEVTRRKEIERAYLALRQDHQRNLATLARVQRQAKQDVAEFKRELAALERRQQIVEKNQKGRAR